ncbi:type VI secretion system baseplate subunit TssG [Catalinimonas niigatensis]|uniref:type VI secretion system baseplate subunit TssG n=1 Tax=Catalinimonas niigatensis TaxID=1397264 RepID=UPI002666F745|nr:type VI secretion system baseplate subunit TssG [Catalinimonas niigatensis]WPP49128.1 type VI secretion system baseplate subunit TssG [Catalinimonas niigatensis]
MDISTKETNTSLKELPVKLKLDLYVEVVIASLIEQGKINPEKLYIKPQGSFSRNYQADLAKVEVIEDRKLEQSAVYVHVNREGIYDMLPEGLFHKNLRKTKHIDTEESVKELKLHREEEKSARKFFLPLEQMFYQQRIMIEIEEQKSLIGLSEAIVDELITDFWQIPIRLDYYQSLCLAYMLPIMHTIVGNTDLTAQCLSILLQVPVSLESNVAKSESLTLAYNRLGSFCLGDNFLLDDMYVPELDSITISIGPLEGLSILDFLPHRQQQDYLDFLVSYFIPAELDWEIDIIVNPAQETFRLGDVSEKGLLNYTTVI